MSLHQHRFAIAVRAFPITCGVYQDFGHKDVPQFEAYTGALQGEKSKFIVNSCPLKPQSHCYAAGCTTNWRCLLYTVDAQI